MSKLVFEDGSILFRKKTGSELFTKNPVHGSVAWVGPSDGAREEIIFWNHKDDSTMLGWMRVGDFREKKKALRQNHINFYHLNPTLLADKIRKKRVPRREGSHMSRHMSDFLV